MSMFSMPPLRVTAEDGQPLQAPCIFKVTMPVSSSKPCTSKHFLTSYQVQTDIVPFVNSWMTLATSKHCTPFPGSRKHTTQLAMVQTDVRICNRGYVPSGRYQSCYFKPPTELMSPCCLHMHICNMLTSFGYISLRNINTCFMLWQICQLSAMKLLEPHVSIQQKGM